MKTLKIKTLFTLALVLFMIGCSNPDDNPPLPPVDGQNPVGEQPPADTPTNPIDYLIEGTAIMVTDDVRIPFIFNHVNGGKAAMVDNDLDGFFDGMTYSENGLQLTFDLDYQTGLPTRMYTSEGAIFIYNYKEDYTLLDIAVLEEGDIINYVRDIETGLDEATSKNYTPVSKNNPDTLEALQGTVSAMSLAWSAGSCIFFASSSAYSFGATLPATVIACGGFLADFLLFAESAAGIDNQYSQQINNASALLGLIGDYSGCATANIADCISLGLTAIDGILNIVEGISLLIGEDNMAIAEGALISGYGDVKVTLTWDTSSDIDLWVTEPDGNVIYYNNPSSLSGGLLDFDDVDGFGPENIFWNENPPIGEYLVQVHYYADNGGGVTNYTVQLEVQGGVQVLQGTLATQDQVNDVARFSTINGAGKSTGFTKLSGSKIYTIELPLKESVEN